ncbi:MAG: transcription antitermination protein NusB [Cytophagales bacterium]|nr:transcription antitermination protein NusB [Cytophagales bacterium]
MQWLFAEHLNPLSGEKYRSFSSLWDKTLQGILSSYALAVTALPLLAREADLHLKKNQSLNTEDPSSLSILAKGKQVMEKNKFALALSEQNIIVPDKEAWHRCCQQAFRQNLFSTTANPAWKKACFSSSEDMAAFLFLKFFFFSKDMDKFCEEFNLYWEGDKKVVRLVLEIHLKLMRENSGFYLNMENINTYLPSFLGAATFADLLYTKTWEEQEERNLSIAKHLENWSVDRLFLVDNILLQMATTEMKWHKDVPIPVIMNEYIDISREYASPDSVSFVNGLLEKLAKDFPNRQEELTPKSHKYA